LIIVKSLKSISSSSLGSESKIKLSLIS
jgi:hypothetical protein